MRRRERIAVIGIIAAAAAWGWPCAPGAQEADPSVEEVAPEIPPEIGPVAPAPPGIEAIEITGERLDATNVQDEAQAITAFDTGELDRLQISNVDRLALNVPGLHVGQQGQNAIITLRGVGTENASITGEPGVAFHVDGIYFGSPAGARTAFYDIQAIEVKRGPQGLLGGKNSTSGAIQVNTMDPTTEYSAQADYTMGNYDRQRVRGHINIPVGEYVAGRLAVFYEGRDGYLDRETVGVTFDRSNAPGAVGPEHRIFTDVSDSQDPFDLDNFGLRGKLRFMPAESLDLVLGYNYFKEGGNGPQADIVPLNATPCQAGQVPGANNPIPPGTTTRVGQIGGCRAPDRDPDPYLYNPMFYPVTFDDDPRKTYTDFGSKQDDLYWGFSGKLQWDPQALPLLGETSVKVLGGFQEYSLDFEWDFDGSDQELFNLFLENVVDEYTSEIQWSGGDRLSWQTSLFFQHQTGEQRLISPGVEEFPDPGVTERPNLSTFASYQPSVSFDTEQWTENKSYGAALHGTYAITDGLSFSLGGRWNKDHKRTFLAQRRVIEGVVFEACEPKGGGTDYGPVSVPLDFPNPSPQDLSEPLPSSCGLKFRGTNWGSRLEWTPRDGHLFYAGIDRGYKSGGFASGGIGSYLPEKIWAYTLGSKSEFFDQTLQFNVEGFFYNYTNMQLTLLDATKVRTENSDARMYGWEVEMRAMPVEGMRLQGLIAYLHTETIDYYTLDPATLGVQPNQTRVTTRDRNERRGQRYPTPRSIRCPIPGQTFQPFCRTLGDKDGLDFYGGNQLSRSPELKWNVSAEYDIGLGRFGTLTPGVQYAWQDEAFYRVFNEYFDKQDAFHETNLRLLWTSPEQVWEAEAFVNNVEDDAIKQNILISPATFGSIPLAWYGEPRFYGMRVSFKY